MLWSQEEKGLFFVQYKTGRIYIYHSIFGVALSVLPLFIGIIPDYTSFIALLIGCLTAYADFTLCCELITKKFNSFIDAFNRYTMIFPYRSFEPFSLYSKDKIGFFSKKWWLLYTNHIKSVAAFWELYRWIIFFLLIAISVLIGVSLSSRKTVITNCGISIASWSITYMFLWQKKYFKLCAKKLGLTDKQFIAIRDYGKNSGA